MRGILPASVPVKPVSIASTPKVPRMCALLVGQQVITVVWLPVGWPRQVREVLAGAVTPDVIAAPELSAGARKTATNAGVSWFDETGAADIALSPTFVIQRDGSVPKRLDTNLGWRPATTAVCEALLTGSEATVTALHERTGMSMSTAATALKFLGTQGFLRADATRGRNAGRAITSRSDLLDAYAAAANRLRSPISIRTAVLWKDSTVSIRKMGHTWISADISWSVTSALSAALMAPLLTQVSPMEIYLDAGTLTELREAARMVGLRESKGGRLLLRPFPTPAKAALSTQLRPEYWSVPWPRAFADLRETGVRGEEAADHLREVFDNH